MSFPFSLRMLSMVWGEKYIDLFKRACVQSLMWPKNKAALAGCTWRVVTRQEHAEEIERIVWNAIDCNLEIELIPDQLDIGNNQPMIDSRKCDPAFLLIRYLGQAAHQCFQEQSKFFLAPPDTIFGDGSVPNILHTGLAQGLCVAVPHVRVLPSILDEVGEKPISNAELVTASFKQLHDSWVHAEDKSDMQSSIVGGVRWSNLGDGLYTVQHRLPTIYMASFFPQDILLFNHAPSMGVWDHTWPGERLIRQARQRTIHSSDVAFIAEVTEAGMNVPAQVPLDVRAQFPPDHYSDDKVHHDHNRLSISCFRAANV